MKTEVSALSPRVAFLDHQRLILNVDNSALKQRIAALAQDKIFKDGIMLEDNVILQVLFNTFGSWKKDDDRMITEIVGIFDCVSSSRGIEEGNREIEANLPPTEPTEDE
ncbi:hypothetical protein V8G54_025547 [Vigna mungo]|uniref:Uncharacterized protein n=1 Tax=Vigna mungo TaxID=3915 RepID=A0AAQ3RNF8_VIGMU